MSLQAPLALLLLLLVPLLGYIGWRKGSRGSLVFPSLGTAKASGTTLRIKVAALPHFLRLLALCLIIIALARPQQGIEKVHDVSKGIAIEMVVDRSGSMGAEMDYKGEALNRLEVVKKVFSEFVKGDGRELTGRDNDLVGMIAFARFADTIAPLTLAHGALDRFLENIELVPRDSLENKTAIGDALALAAARLQKVEESIARQTGEKADRYEIKSKIIILLTDGENNAGDQSPKQAAELAKKWGIKIYCIGVGGDDFVKVQTLLGPRMIRTGSGVDQDLLKDIAESTGGAFWMAEDGNSLHTIYTELNELEKSEVESVRYVDYREYYTGFVLAAFGLLLLEIVLRHTWLRTLP